MSDVRPPSRPPPSRSGPVASPAGASGPTPPRRPPPSSAPPTPPPPRAEEPEGDRPRRRWLVAAIVGALVVVLGVGAGALLLVGGGGVSDEDRDFFAGQYEAARADVERRRGSGVCAVADAINVQILGTDRQLPMVFESYRSAPWDVDNVIGHVAYAESLVALLNEEHGTSVPQLELLEDRWRFDIRYRLDDEGWDLDDDDVDQIIALLDETLATVDAAPFLASCPAAPAASAALGSKDPRPAPAAITIDPTKRHTATIATTEGNIVIALDAVNAPTSVNNFVYLARAGFYDGLLVNRAVRDFLIQAGSPDNTNLGDAGYAIQVELPPGPIAVGSVGWARRASDPIGTAGSQFFVITSTRFLNLDQSYGYLGTVTSGLDVAQRIAGYAPASGEGKPTKDVTITKVTITVT